MNHDELFQAACHVIPGGVNSPVRAFTGVGGTPIFVTKGQGARIETADGRTLTDYCCSWGAMILGHAHPVVTEAIHARAQLGTTFGIGTPDEVTFAQRLTSLVPGMEMVRAVNSGTEAVMTAIRLARGVTNRNYILKFDGCYHGHSDAMLVKSGSGLLTGGFSSSLGVPPEVVSHTLTAPYNDIDAVSHIFEQMGSQIAAVIVEPVAGNMGLVQPAAEFLPTLRTLTKQAGALLICDEVINGFRFGFSSYCACHAHIVPDLITLGKIVGGGLPLAVVGGSEHVMRALSPSGRVYQAGTLSGNPLAVAAGLAVLKELEAHPPYNHLTQMGNTLEQIIHRLAQAYQLPIHCAHFQGVWTLFCKQEPVHNLKDAQDCNTKLYAQIFHGLLERGIYIAPSQFECNFISAAHTQADLDTFAQAFEEVCRTCAHQA